jgi:hypothetical protein
MTLTDKHGEFIDRAVEEWLRKRGIVPTPPPVVKWKGQMVPLTEMIEIINEKRASVLRSAAAWALPLDPHAVEALTLVQITGLGDAAREGRDAFVKALIGTLGFNWFNTGKVEATEQPAGQRAGANPLNASTHSSIRKFNERLRKHPIGAAIVSFFILNILLGLLLGGILGPTKCRDGWASHSIGHRGACSWHGGVDRSRGAVVTVLSLAGAFGVAIWLTSKPSSGSE